MNDFNSPSTAARTGRQDTTDSLMALIAALRGGPYSPKLGPIPQAYLHEWLSGFREAVELLAQPHLDMDRADFLGLPEWRALQDPRSVEFARGANACRAMFQAANLRRNENCELAQSIGRSF